MVKTKLDSKKPLLTTNIGNERKKSKKPDNPVEKEFNELESMIEKAIPLTHVAERVSSHAWTKQIDGWKRALNDRVWRENVGKVKHLNQLQQSVEQQLAEGLLLLKQDKNKVGGRRADQVKDQNNLLKESLTEKRKEEEIALKAAERVIYFILQGRFTCIPSITNFEMYGILKDGELMVREFKSKMKDHIERVKDSVVLNYSFEQENVEELKRDIQMDLRRVD